MRQKKRVRGAPLFLETAKGTVSVVEELEVTETGTSVRVTPMGFYVIDARGVRRVAVRGRGARRATFFAGAMALAGLLGWALGRGRGT